MNNILSNLITNTDRAKLGGFVFGTDASVGVGAMLGICRESGSLPMAGPGGVVGLQPLAQREQRVLAQHGAAPLGPEPAHRPAPAPRPRRQRARPRRVPRHRAPHHVAHAEAPPPTWRHTREARVSRRRPTHRVLTRLRGTHTHAHTIAMQISSV